MLNKLLPVEIVLAPEWWHKHTGITFDRDFFFHPLKRVESEQKMEKILYEKWGQYGLGKDKDSSRPEIGAVHLAAGYFISEMLGCEVIYGGNHPPQVRCMDRDNLVLNPDSAFRSKTFSDFEKMADVLKKKYGYLTGDINWGGILNIALDIRGQNLFLDMAMDPKGVYFFLNSIYKVVLKMTDWMDKETGTTSVSVNRTVRHFEKPVLLHSECSHTMISCEDYETHLMKYDILMGRGANPFGIHYCGNDPHRYAESFGKLPRLDFLDVGWGGDIKKLRMHLPNTFFNIRLSPVELIRQSEDEIQETVTRLINDSGNPYLTGICCINIDDKVSDSKIDAIFQTVKEYIRAM